VGIISQIPEEDYKRFTTVETENGLNILELFLLKEYPFSSEVPNTDEVKSFEDTVKGFLGQFSG
jgi:hypothetical protein